MEKEILTVPSGIRYISEWSDYSLENYQFPHILNKTLTGCGYTEYCLTSPFNVILCSPRRILLENKRKQHRDEINIFYARNDIEKNINFEKDLIDDTPKKAILKTMLSLGLTEEDKRKRVLELKQNIKEHYSSCQASPFSEAKPCKILVTYDSFRHVKEALGEDIEKFYVVIDEFQSIFTDAKFKSDTELEFMKQLQDLKRVCYVSATPMLKEYLDMLDEFKDLPYFELDWYEKDHGRVFKPQINIKYCGKKNTIQTEIRKIIQKYLGGIYESYKFKDENGKLQEIQSREAVFYVNSVKDIAKAIKSNGLTVDQCNILVSRTKENENTIRKAFGGKVKDGITYIGEVPERGEQHKTFTFCTRTVYLGADFYSTNARSFIFSNANIDCLSVDISMDLPQILGRQRLEINPWKNSADIYITLRYEGEKSRKEYQNYLAAKEESTNILLGIYNKSTDIEKNKLVEKYERDAKNSNYKSDYVAVNHHSGSTLKPIFNKLMMVAEIRTFVIQRYDYVDRVSVFANLSEYDIIRSKDKFDIIMSTFNNKFTTFVDKMKYICEQAVTLTDDEFNLLIKLIPMEYNNYISTLGIERIKANSYIRAKIEAEFQQKILGQKDNMLQEILNEFKIGERDTKANIKVRLGNIYNKYGYAISPKANDLEDWYILKSITINQSGKRVNGFEIVKKKGD